MIRKISRIVYNPKLSYSISDLSSNEYKIIQNPSESFIAKYQIPSSIIPYLQTRVLLEKNRIIFKETRYSDPLIIPFSKITQITIEQNYLRVHTNSVIYEVKIPSNSYIFADLVKEQYNSLHGSELDELHEKSIESLERKFE